ncbi:hypothetical protein [Limnochorda pilosa]|uniref:Uncharacterized protein n=1 Tax=Limnochorda pilosa TaxID=1555112 RepID=A0A0K2SLP6_LIMPI|nr:hypothetical protein [Limnochorda pilosa]BAS27739.1 hypothetical protein LIP_1898 [Limnochorda pilosa]
MVALALFFARSEPAAAVGVRPLVIDLEVRAGETAPFELILSPSGQRERVHVRLFQPTQLPTGDLTYEQADPDTFPTAAWVKLDRDTVEVPGAQEVRIPGRVEVPFGVSGSHTVVLMVEPETPTQGGGVAIQVRYAVRLNVRVPGVGVQARAALAGLGLVANEARRPFVRVRLNNPSPLDYRVEMEATVRDANRRLIERIPLQTEQGRRSGQTAARIYPGSRLDFAGRVQSPLVPGSYELQAFARYAEGRQAVARETVLVHEGEFALPEGRLLVQVDPPSLQLEANPGALRTVSFSVGNRTQEPVVVAAGTVSAGGGAADVWPLARLRSSFPMTLRPGQSRRISLTVQSPREQEPQGYYGTLALQALPEAEVGQEGAQPQQVRLPVALVLGQVPDPVLELGQAQYVPASPPGSVDAVSPGAATDSGGPAGSAEAPAGEAPGGTLYLAVHNGGLRHQVLEGSTVSIEDAEGDVVASGLTLSLPADPPWLLPGAWAQLEAEGVPPLDPGSYTLQIVLRSPDATLLDQATELVVGEEEGS